MSWFEDMNRHLRGVEKGGKPDPVYLLYGSEAALQDHAAGILEAAYRRLKPDCERLLFGAEELDAGDLKNALYASSLFESGKVLKIVEVKSLIPSVRKVLISYLESPDPENLIILAVSKIERRNKFLSQLESLSRTLYCNPPYDNEILPWVLQTVRSGGKDIDTAAAEKLVSLFGTQVDDLRNEIGKLELYTGTLERITVEHVIEHSAFNRNFSTDDLMTALIRRDRPRALDMLNALLVQDEKIQVLLVISIFRVFWLIRSLKGSEGEKVDLQTLARKLGIFGTKSIENIRRNHRNYSMDEIDRILDALVQTDVNIKTSSMDKFSNFLILFEEITGPK